MRAQVGAMDNLTSQSTTDFLAANQGRVLKSQIDSLSLNSVGKNLAYNPWFTINQRGFTSGDFTVTEYCTDRWLRISQQDDSDDGTVEMVGSMMKLTPSATSATYTTRNEVKIAQYYDDNVPWASTAVTLSVELDIGFKAYLTMASNESTKSNYFEVYPGMEVGLGISRVAGDKFITISASYLPVPNTEHENIILKHVKLEIGTTSTIDGDFMPEYEAELQRCRWFFTKEMSPCLGYAWATSATQGSAVINLSTPMRTLPAVQFTTPSPQINFTTAEGYVYAITSASVVDSLSPSHSGPVSSVGLTFESTGMSNGLSGYLSSDGGGYSQIPILLNAEIYPASV